VLGPKKLPGAVKQIGRWVGRARSMARQFREQLEQEVNNVESSLNTNTNPKPTPPHAYTPPPAPPAAAEPPTTPPSPEHAMPPEPHIHPVVDSPYTNDHRDLSGLPPTPEAPASEPPPVSDTTHPR